jgi:prevent-host-death family protein
MATTDDGNRTTTPRTIKASTFKAQCLRLMDEVAESGEELVITKHGRPVSRLVPYNTKPRLGFGRNRKNIYITGDIVSPMPPEWFRKPDDTDQDLF